MTIENTYNGWTNYETWLTNLHFENFDFSDYKEDGTFEGMNEEEIRDWVADYIETTIEEFCFGQLELGRVENLFITDVLSQFLKSVDWENIADSYLEDLKDAR